MQSAAEIAARWQQRMAASGDKWQAGVESVQVAPGVAAARQKNAYVQGVTQSADKWATRVASVSLADWKDSMINKGKGRIGSGAAAAQGKFTDFMSQFLPHVERSVAGLPPRGSFEQNVQRMVSFSNAVHQFSYKK